MRKRTWTEQNLRTAVKSSRSVRQALSLLKLVEAGGNYGQIKKYLLVKNSNYQSNKLRKRLIREGLKKAMCEECGWAKKSKDGRIPVEFDHINGDRLDNRLENLRILCPNCHSLKLTHRGLNRKKKIMLL